MRNKINALLDFVGGVNVARDLTRLTAHPYATLREKIRIGNNADRITNHTYIYATQWGNCQIAKQYELAKKRKGWIVFEVECGHDIMIDAPNELARILVSAS